MNKARTYGGFQAAKAAAKAGGELVFVSLRPLPEGENGGCGAPTHVAGTNGGTMPCGALLTQSGATAPYYCGACYERRERVYYLTLEEQQEILRKALDLPEGAEFRPYLRGGVHIIVKAGQEK